MRQIRDTVKCGYVCMYVCMYVCILLFQTFMYITHNREKRGTRKNIPSQLNINYQGV